MDLRGYGGQERKLATFFGHNPVDAHLYDAVEVATGNRFEYKKGDLSWLDLRKWVDLSTEDSAIIVRFVRFDRRTGKYLEHRDITYGQLLDLLPQDLIEAARPFCGTRAQLKYPFRAFNDSKKNV
jgi:hypothetical protein